jgi:hypothetical protein
MYSLLYTRYICIYVRGLRQNGKHEATFQRAEEQTKESGEVGPTFFPPGGGGVKVSRSFYFRVQTKLCNWVRCFGGRHCNRMNFDESKLGRVHVKHAAATWSFHFIICLKMKGWGWWGGGTVTRSPVAGASGYVWIASQHSGKQKMEILTQFPDVCAVTSLI